MSKIATKQDVLDVANVFIGVNGTVTTLDVKNSLRGRKFWVDQSEVSQLMDALYQEGKFSRTYNGMHYIYAQMDNVQNSYTKLDDDIFTNGDGLNQGCMVQGSLMTIMGCINGGKSMIANVKKDYEWEAYVEEVTGCVAFVEHQSKKYPSSYTRSKARWAFAKEAGLKYNDVRARKVEKDG